MAKKQKTHRTYTFNIVHLCAFLALSAAAILLVIGPLLGWLLRETGGGVIVTALNMIAQYCLLIAIAIPAWMFVRGRSKGWKIFYFIVLAIYIAGTILGVALGI